MTTFAICWVLGLSLPAFGQPAGTKLWEFVTSASQPSQVSAPAIGPDGTLYFTQGRKLWAITPDGTNKWSLTDYYAGVPAVGAGGMIYVGLADTSFSAVAAIRPDGTRIWPFGVQSLGLSSIAVGGDGTLYVRLTSYGELYALAPNGVPKWHEYDEANFPTIGANGIIYYLGARSVRGLRTDGTLLNRDFYLGNEAMCPPAIGADGTIYCGYEGGKFCAVNPDLSRKWTFDLGIPNVNIVRMSEPVIAPDGTVYFLTGSGRLYSMTPGGSNNWNLPFGISPLSAYPTAPAVANDGTIYFGTGTNFFAVTPSGSEAWRFSTSGEVSSSPAIGADGTVYFGTADGKLYALKGTARLARSAWPMEGHDLRRSRKSSCFVGQPCFDAIQTRKTGGFEMTLVGGESRQQFVEASTNLLHWTPLTNGASANGTLFIFDPATNFPHRFYRATSP